MNTEPQQFEGQQPSHAVGLLCKMFVERTLKDQQELAAAANSAEPNRQQDGWQLNIERGLWVRPVQPIPTPSVSVPPSPTTGTELPNDVE